MNHFNYGIIIGAIESAPLLGAYAHNTVDDHFRSLGRNIGQQKMTAANMASGHNNITVI